MPRTENHPITVKEALQLPALRIGVPEVLAGREQLERTIRWVHAGEFPEMSTVLKGGELLLTTGMGTPAGDRAAASWLGDLDDCGISGLVVELGSALEAVPAAIVAEARRRELPLIALHKQIAFVEATEVIHRRILAHQASIAAHGEAASARLTDLLIDGAGTADLVAAVAELLDCPVVLARASGAVLFQSPRRLRDADVASLWESRRRELEEAPPTLALPIRLGGDEHWAELAAISVNGGFGPVEAAMLERAAPCVAVALRREHETQALVGRARGEFLHTLAYGDQELTEREAAARAALLDFDRRAPWLLPVAITNSAGQLYEERWERVVADLRGLFRRRGRPAMLGLQSGSEGVLLVAGLAAEADRPELADEIGEAVAASAGELGLAAVLQVSVGRAARGWRELRSALQETLESAGAAVWRPPAPWHDVAAPDIPELLAPMRATPVLRRFVDSRLRPLVEHDEQHRSQLVQTLEAYYAHGGRKADAARALHLERQSLYKRLARIAALLQADLDDEETQLALQLALRARRLLDRG